MDTVIGDLRLAIRQLVRKPAFTLTAVLTLAIGMGVNTVAFTVVNGLLFSGSAVSGHPDLVRVFATPGGDEGGYVSVPDFQRFADASKSAIDLAAEGRSAVSWRHDGTSETAWVLYVTNNYFSMVDVKPIAGPATAKAIALHGGDQPAAVIGERFWRDKLGARSIAGLTLRMNDTDVSVAGVLPNSYTGPAGIYSPDIWLPLDDLRLFGAPPRMFARDSRWLYIFGRMTNDATVPQVRSLLESASVEMARDWPDTHKDRGVVVRTLGEGNSELRGLTIGASIGMGIIGMVLLLACFNVANLLLARAVERERDMGLRAALGAKPSRLIRLVVTEGFVLAVVSGALALLLAWWTQSLVGAFAIPIEEPQHLNLAPNINVVGFVLLLILIAGVLPGLWPAIASARIDLVRVLGSQGGTATGGRPSRLRKGLVGAQIAGSTAFLALSALFVQSFSFLSTNDYGFAKDQLIIAEVSPSTQGYDAARTARYFDQVMARIAALPGISSVALADRAPFFIGFNHITEVGDQKIATYAVSPDYFKTMGIGLVFGRALSASDASTDVIVNGLLADKLSGSPFTVVGITAKTHTRGLDRESPTLYRPIAPKDYEAGMSIIVRTASEATPFVRSVIEAAHSVDPNISMETVQTMSQRMEVPLWPFHTVSWMFSICGGLALLMATVGLTGMVIHSVNRRMREFGVRMSVGATSKDLMMDVLRGSTSLLLPGLVAGLLLSAAGARVIQYVFIGVNVLNPLTYAAVALLECAIVITACLPPAIRASRVDPLVALRAE